ncbi:hypothetical protein GALL_545540 [mine drainage metagenome]|uniref:Uncharacterized protein n=1 Tax=mine drainage metagenome TaxID=410659 RepID=A0A1J5NYM6_9ZZZZ
MTTMLPAVKPCATWVTATSWLPLVTESGSAPRLTPGAADVGVMSYSAPPSQT